MELCWRKKAIQRQPSITRTPDSDRFKDMKFMEPLNRKTRKANKDAAPVKYARMAMPHALFFRVTHRTDNNDPAEGYHRRARNKLES